MRELYSTSILMSRDYLSQRSLFPMGLGGDEISAGVIIQAKYRVVGARINAIGSRPYTPETLHVKLDRRRTDRTVANRGCHSCDVELEGLSRLQPSLLFSPE